MGLQNHEVIYSPRSQSFCLNTDGKNTKAIPAAKPKGFGFRHLIALLGFWGFSMAYATRCNLSIAIIVMAKAPPITKELSQEAVLGEPELYPVTTTSDDSVDLDNLNNEAFTSAPNNTEACGNEDLVAKPSRSPNAGEFFWDEEERGFIQASFFWGYVITQIPGGIVATKFGGKWIFGIGMLINGILTVLIPMAARSNIYMIIYVRFIQGLAQGVVFPAMQTILANWSPVEERGTLSAIAYSGCPFGAAATMVCSGYLLESEKGWPSVFYTTGAITILFAFSWCFFVSDKPSENQKISEAEKNYIIGSIGPQNSSYSSGAWKNLLKSVPVWTIAFAQFGHDWVMFTLLMGLPSYLKTVLKFDMEQDCWLTAFPYITQWLFSVLITMVADKVILKGWLKTGSTRKLCHGLAEFGPALALIGVLLVHCNRTVIVSFLAVAVTLSGAACGSFLPNQVEIAPKYAGMIMGLTNTIGNMAGFGTAMTIGALTKNEPSRTNWMYVFGISIGITCFNAVIYIAFSTSVEQSWNNSSKEDSPQVKISDEEADDVIVCEVNPRGINDQNDDGYD